MGDIEMTDTEIISKVKNNYLEIGLHLIRNNQFFYKTMLSACPDIYADIVSYKADPNCVCKSKIIHRISESEDSVRIYHLILKFILENKDIVDLSIFQSPTENFMPGKRVIIDDSDVAYNELISTAIEKEWTFTGLSVVPRNNKLEIFFY